MYFRRQVDGNLAEKDAFFYITPEDDYVGVSKISYGYQRRKGIHPCNAKYNDLTWRVVSPNGPTHSVDFGKVKGGIAGFSQAQLADWLRSTLVSLIDRGSVDAAVRRMNTITNLLQKLIAKEKAVIKAYELPFVEEFLTEIGITEVDLQILDSKDTPGQRELAHVFTYLKFDAAIKKFWNEDMPIEKRMAYAPLYHYWMICNILPTRPIEFIGTPTDCTYSNELGHYVKIRKGQIKGSGRKTQNVYHLDHPVARFATHSTIVKMMDEYKLANNGHEYEVSEQDVRLYSTYWYDLYFGTKSNGMFTTATLQRLLGRFYVEVLQDEYGYQIIDFDQEPSLEKMEITVWHLYDLRHWAIMNMTYRGVDPAYITKYSGHTDPAEFTHYGSNIGSMTKSWVHYMMHYQNPVLENEMKRSEVANPSYYTPVKDGICLNQLPWTSKGPVCSRCDDCETCFEWQRDKRYDVKLEEDKIVKKANQMMELFLALLASGKGKEATKALRETQKEVREIIKNEVKMCRKTA